MFSGDIQIVLSNPKHQILNITKDLEKELSLLFNWCSQSCLPNESTSQVIIVGTQVMLRDLPSDRIQIAETALTANREVKNLGVHVGIDI